MDHFSYLIDRQHRFLLLGIVFLVLSVVFTLSGGTLERFRGIVYRAEDPKRFWGNIAFYCLAGLICIGLYLCQIAN
jgi:hypothetical protein